MQEGAFQFRTLKLMILVEFFQLSITLEADEYWAPFLELFEDAGH